MCTVTLTTDIQMPSIGLGTWQLEGDTCSQVVLQALELGYRGIDTAQGYDNERAVGDAIRRSTVPREAIFVTTKIWPDHLAQDPLIVHGSLDRLNLHRVDLLLIHWPSPTLPLERYLEPLTRLKEDGVARAVGVSNFPAALLDRAVRLCPSICCNQIELHPYLNQSVLLSRCTELGVLAISYCPLARGRVVADPELTAIGRRHGKSAPQVALRWLLQQGQVAAVPKATSALHLRDNLDVHSFALSAGEMGRIQRLNRSLRLIDPDFASWGPS